MRMQIDTALQHLRCVNATDPSGEDEPYLWVFFIVVDGDTVRQRLGDPLRLSANITVHSGSGRPGNLNEAKGYTGARAVIHVPGSVGRHQKSIKSIVLNLPLDTTRKVFIPGRMMAICTAIDEESVPRDAMEAAFNAVKTHIQNRLNDFFNSLELIEFAAALSNSLDPIGAASVMFNEILDGLIAQIGDEARQIAEDTAIVWVAQRVTNDWWDPGNWFSALASFADKDEPIGSHTFTIGETEILDHSLYETLQADLRQPHINPGVAWYVLTGYCNATVHFVPGDYKLSQLPDRIEVLDAPELHMLRVERECIKPGTVVEVQRSAHFQQWQVFVDYPFMRYRYAVDGQELVGDSGTIRLNKVVGIPRFDESQFALTSISTENRLVTINYQRLPVDGVPQLHRILITNEPADGNFDLLLTIDGVLPSGSMVSVATEELSILGQSVDFLHGFFDGYMACVIHKMKGKLIRVKKDLRPRRTPEVAWNQYQEIVTQLDDLHSLRIYDARTIETIKKAMAGKMKLELPT